MRAARSFSSGGYLLDVLLDMTPTLAIPRIEASGHAGAIQGLSRDGGSADHRRINLDAPSGHPRMGPVVLCQRASLPPGRSRRFSLAHGESAYWWDGKRIEPLARAGVYWDGSDRAGHDKVVAIG